MVKILCFPNHHQSNYQMILRPTQNEQGPLGYIFYCLACQELHHIPVYQPNFVTNNKWEFNENLSCPTFNPSIVIQINPNAKCHFSINNGKIKYHGDSTNLANQEIDLIPIPEQL